MAVIQRTPVKPITSTRYRWHDELCNRCAQPGYFRHMSEHSNGQRLHHCRDCELKKARESHFRKYVPKSGKRRRRLYTLPRPEQVIELVAFGAYLNALRHLLKVPGFDILAAAGLPLHQQYLVRIEAGACKPETAYAVERALLDRAPGKLRYRVQRLARSMAEVRMLLNVD